MFAIVARSVNERFAQPGPKNSTNWPTTPLFLSKAVIVKTKSVAVVSRKLSSQLEANYFRKNH